MVAGPTLVVSGWVSWVLISGSIATALLAGVAFLTKIALPLANVVSQIQRDFPVWADIAEKFSDHNGGETISRELQALASNDELAAANQRAMMAQLETVITQVKATDEKLSDTRHKVIGEFATLRMAAGGAATLVEAIVNTSRDLQEVRSELQSLRTAT